MRYAAFISYSSVDHAMGERVQKALESFVVPAPLRGQDFGRGAVPKRITPIFRDRSDADASADLGATLSAALKASDALIVLCSPAAGRSKWVGEEIREFKRSGRWDRIYPAIIDGLPGRFDAKSNPLGAFPPALFECWQGSVFLPDSTDPEPLAPDARLAGDGLPYTVLKLVAALTAIPLTTLTQRQAEAERRERNTARWIAGAMAVLALGAVVGGWTSWLANVEARTRLENAVEMAARRVDDAASFHDRYGVPSSVIRELLTGAQKDFDELTQDAPATPTLQLQRARLDRLFAQLYELVGDNEQHQALAKRALAGLEHVPTERQFDSPDTWFARLPSQDNVETERALGLEAVGQALAIKGDAPGARSAFQAMSHSAKGLERTDVGTGRARILEANARSHLSRISYESGALETALAELDAAVAILASDPALSDIAGDLAKLQSDRAEILLELGRHSEALALQQMAVGTLDKELAQTPATRRALAAALVRQGDMRLAANRDSDGAKLDYIKARSMLTGLLAEDGARTDIKRDLSLAHERVGDALLQAGDVNGAEVVFAACLALRRELADHDPSNSEWRRDLAVALERKGAVDSLQGRHAEAFAALNESLDLRTAVYKKNENDPVATRDLAITWMQLGKAHVVAHARLHDIDGAYAKAISLLSRLVANASAESRLKRDLALAHAERGDAFLVVGKFADACADLKIASSLIADLRTQTPDDGQLAQDEIWIKDRQRRLPHRRVFCSSSE